MNSEELIAHVREECIDALVERYAELFTNFPIEQFQDPGMHRLASEWKAADAATQSTMKQLIRLGSQNTAAVLLAFFDDASGYRKPELSLLGKSFDGSTCDLGQDLLDTFWAQEEIHGRVNVKS